MANEYLAMQSPDHHTCDRPPATRKLGHCQCRVESGERIDIQFTVPDAQDRVKSADPEIHSTAASPMPRPVAVSCEQRHCNVGDVPHSSMRPLSLIKVLRQFWAQDGMKLATSSTRVSPEVAAAACIEVQINRC